MPQLILNSAQTNARKINALAAIRNDEPTNQTVLAKEARTQGNVSLAHPSMKPLNRDNKSGTKGTKTLSILVG